MNLLGSIYGLAVKTRNSLYDRGTWQSRRLAGPVVSVGNLSMGGAGKTPFVILLGGLLKEQGISFDVLSRGYGRETRGVLEVDPNGTAAQFGDEPLLIARKLGVPVIVGESRFRAGEYAEKRFGEQLHILDDGFQHRSLARDFDVVLLTPEDLKDQLIPSGRLRESIASLSRADAIVLSGDDRANAFVLAKETFWRLSRNIDVTGAPERPVAFCGIARPNRFFAQLKAAGIFSVAEIDFRDHHSYTVQDVEKLCGIAKERSANGFITTEKDAINLGKLSARLQPLAIATVIMQLENAPEFLDTILRVLEQRKPQA